MSGCYLPDTVLSSEYVRIQEIQHLSLDLTNIVMGTVF